MCFHYQDKDHSYNLRVTIMKQRSFLSILCFVLLSIVLASISAQTCIENRKNFIPNGTYDENRRHILSSLPSNVTARDAFFYNASTGQEPTRVYAVGMWIPRADANDCSDCIKGVSDWLIQSCPNQTDAYYWGLDPTLCLVRYSNTSFTGSAAHWETTPKYVVYNTADIPSNLTEFTAVWENLMNHTLAEASATSITPSSSDNHYKVGSAPWINFQMIYVLMQCTPDISPGDCNYCLRQSVTDYQACCMHNKGGYVMRPICFFRWQFFTFSKAFGNIMSAPPLSSPSLQIPVVPQPPTSTSGIGSRKNSLRPIVKIVVPVVVGVFIIIILVLLARRSAILFWKRKPNQEIDLDQSGITTVHSLQFDFKTIEAATEKFAINNKLGEGGFGEVFKGTLPNGTEVAVKRLSKKSSQGAHEFKNEVVVVAKLQHRNLVRLLGFCLEGEEKILVYEFVQHKSLDYFLFDTTKQGQLDWTKRYIIIVGITRGILYLHQDSRLTIIHRDLKASNILLDANMIPKIADFGMAKIFGIDQSGANTNRIVGTRGYMSPEYVTEGLFSTKSDVYSFGVLALEIICGRKNRFVHQSDTIVENLVTYAWKLWRSGTPLDLVDPTISENCQTEEVTRCIHIALLCVQDDPADRPSLSTINIMLTSNTIVLPDPQQPGFFFPSRRNQERDGHESSHSTTVKSNSQSINDVTITDLDPR